MLLTFRILLLFAFSLTRQAFNGAQCGHEAWRGGINNGQLAESLVSSYQRNYPQTSTTLLLVQILISF